MTHHETHSFGDAIHAIKSGKRAARFGWNGKGMWIFIKKGSFDGPARGFEVGAKVPDNHPSTQDGVSFSLFEPRESGAPIRLPHLCMKSASGAIVVGWLASQTDVLADDWQILEEI